MKDNAEIRDIPLEVKCYENAYVVPTKILCVFDAEGHFVPYTSKRMYSKSEYKIPKDAYVSNGQEEYYDEEVVYIGFLRGHWGHFIVDSSIRLWALGTQECQNKRILIKIEGMESFYYKLFEQLGVEKERLLQIDKPARFKKILVPELAYLPERYISKEFLMPFDRVAANINLDKEAYKKIYLSRVHFARGKKELGEKEIQDIFEANGFKILYPEELSMEEQIWYYKNCEVLVTTNGTVAHNIVFANKCKELVILRRFADNNVHQKIINHLKGIELVYINTFHKASNHDDCLMVRTDELVNYLKKKEMYISKESILKKVINFIGFKVPYMYRWINPKR